MLIENYFLFFRKEVLDFFVTVLDVSVQVLVVGGGLQGWPLLI